jgi:hypothetical protein
MVLGLYGVLYLEVARIPEKGRVIAAAGLADQVFGPIELAHLIWTGMWPVRTAVLCVTNDLIWCIPFGLYLYDVWPVFRKKQQTA